MQIFKKNDFFVGVSLPEPEVMDPLEEKLAKSVTPEGLDFALVINARAPQALWTPRLLIKFSLMCGAEMPGQGSERAVVVRPINAAPVL
jgi:hypothetical protein